jgi:hypothetical protein
MIERIKVLHKAVEDLDVSSIHDCQDTPDTYTPAAEDEYPVEFCEEDLLMMSGDRMTYTNIVVSKNYVYWEGSLRGCDNVTVTLGEFNRIDLFTIERMLRLVETGGTESISSIISKITEEEIEDSDKYIMIEDRNGKFIRRGDNRSKHLSILRRLNPLANFFYIDVLSDDSIIIKEAPDEKISDTN